MNESYVTLQGWVGTNVEERVTTNGAEVSSFRVGCTPRYLKEGAWVDGETSWFTVNCWRALGRNVAQSIRSGDAVVIHGRVRTDVWQKDPDAPKSVRWIVDATFVGHDLTRGTSTFLKAVRQGPVDPVDDPDLKQHLHNDEVEGPRLDSFGEPVQPAA